NPDDRSRVVAEHHFSTDDPSIAREPPLPEIVRDDHDALAARFSVVVVKRSSEDRLDAEHREEICSRVLSRNLFGIAVAGQARAGVKVRGHILKDRVLLFPVKEVSEVDHVLGLASAGQMLLPYNRESIGGAIRQRAQQDRVYNAEDRRVGAYSKRKRDNRDKSKAGPCRE